MKAQDSLLPFTVRITGSDGDHDPGEPLGAGILIGPDTLLTCAHVVRDALGITPSDCALPPAGAVACECVYAEAPWRASARVIAWSPPQSTPAGEAERWDLAVLSVEQMLDGSPPDDIAVFPRWARLPDTDSFRHRIDIHGFGSDSDGGWAAATCGGLLSSLEHEVVQSAHELWTRPGFSGGPAWSSDHEAFIGILRADLPPDDQRPVAPKPSRLISTALLLKLFPPLYLRLIRQPQPDPYCHDDDQRLFSLARHLVEQRAAWPPDRALERLRNERPDLFRDLRALRPGPAPTAAIFIHLAMRNIALAARFLDHLLERSSDSAADASAHIELRKLADPLIARADTASVPGIVHPAPTPAQEAPAPDRGRPSLMIELGPSPATGSAEIGLWAWLLDARSGAPIGSRFRPLQPQRTTRIPGRRQQPGLPATTHEAIAEVVAALTPDADPAHRLLIEVFLPDAWLDHPFDDWQDAFGDALRHKWPMILRLRDRAMRLRLRPDRNGDPRSPGWTRLWQRGEQAAQGSRCAAIIDAAADGAIRGAVDDADKALFVLLASPLHPPGSGRMRRGDHQRPALQALHAEGIGRSIWPRGCRLDKTRTEQALAALLRDGHLRDLPDLLHRHRRGLTDPNDGIHRWVLLWDDPNRRLPALSYRDLNRAGAMQ